jgi:hypothetical protein
MAKRMIVSFILDETGSMQAAKGQTIAGFNEYVTELAGDKNANAIRFSMTKFNSEKVEVVHDGVKMRQVQLLTEESYQPKHLTPLYDAIGHTVHAVEKRCGGKKHSVLIVIQTDGEENHSREYTRDSIFSLIDEKKREGWTFAFLGADQDAWITGQLLGIDKGNVLSYCSAQTKAAFQTVTRATLSYTNGSGSKTSRFFSDHDDSSSSGT